MNEPRVALVTGASRGIGRAIAKSLAQQGHAVACAASRAANAEETVNQIKAEGGKAMAFGADMANAESITAMVQQIEQELGPPLILVNNAGITKDVLLMRMSDDDWESVLKVNLTGAYHTIKACQRGMLKARWGRIVQISSIVGLHGAAGQANYAASKAGLIGLTLAVAKELGSRNVTCNAVAPGFIETDMTAELPEEMRKLTIERAPLGRLGTPEDIAGAVAFMCSDAAGYVTGQVLTVDGGLSL